MPNTAEALQAQCSLVNLFSSPSRASTLPWIPSMSACWRGSGWYCALLAFFSVVVILPIEPVFLSIFFVLGATLNVHRVLLQRVEHLLQPHLLAAANHQNASLQFPVTAQAWVAAAAQCLMELPAVLDPMVATILEPATALMEFAMVGHWNLFIKL